MCGSGTTTVAGRGERDDLLHIARKLSMLSSRLFVREPRRHSNKSRNSTKAKDQLKLGVEIFVFVFGLKSSRNGGQLSQISAVAQ